MSRNESIYLDSLRWNAYTALARAERERDVLWFVVLITVWRYQEALEHMEALCREMDRTQQANWRQTDKLSALMVRNGD